MRRVHIVTYIVSMSIFALFIGASTSYAASLTGTLTQPVEHVASSVSTVLPIQDTATDTVSNPVSAVTDPVTDVLPSTTAVSQTTPTSEISTSMSAMSLPQPTATMSTETASTATASKASSPRTAVRSTAAQSAALANGQSIDGAGRINYGSGQISQAMATLLYRGAALVSAIGFILYAVSSIRRNRTLVRGRLAKVTQ